MLPIRKTIHEATKVYDTGARPLLVTCDDVNDWVCKHDNANKLVNEIIGSKFAEIWNIFTPEICLIEIPDEHIPQQSGRYLQIINFRKLCFGSRFLQNCKEIDESSLLMFRDKNFSSKVKQKQDFLKIAMYDIWLSNEDRNNNNSNLIIDFSNPNNHKFCVFDHGEIFNSGALKHGLYQIIAEESIINTDLAGVLFKKGRKLTEAINKIVESFYLCVSECEMALTDIISLIPPQWGIDTEALEQNIRKELFNEKWLKDCETSFRSFIQIKFDNK
ncbi:MAG: HipA family kinase [Bacteroidota bacterium]